MPLADRLMLLRSACNVQLTDRDLLSGQRCMDRLLEVGQYSEACEYYEGDGAGIAGLDPASYANALRSADRWLDYYRILVTQPEPDAATLLEVAEISGARLGRPDDAVGHLKEALRAGAGIASVGQVFGSVGADDDLLSMLAETALDATGEPAVDELESTGLDPPSGRKASRVSMPAPPS